MNLGKKIKDIRQSKLMTQSQLAGDRITRNMLSCIENGTANPSLDTIVYLAARLGVPAGFLLAEDSDDFVFNKMGSMRDIKVAYMDGNYELCRSICLSSFKDRTDDEIELILSDCCLELALESAEKGHLRMACVYIEETIDHSQKTLYHTEENIHELHILSGLLSAISPSLDSYFDDQEENGTINIKYGGRSNLCRYIMALKCIEDEDFDAAKDYLKYDSEYSENMYKMHLLARENMKQEKFAEALTYLNVMIKTDVIIPRLLMFLACCDIEICSRETGDYKSAYEFSQSKLSLLETMLSDIL